MRNKGIILSVFSIISVVYITLSLMLTANKNSVFWAGFGFAIFSIFVMATTTITSTQKRDSAFPIDISAITFSAVYLITVFGINILCGYVLKASLSVFVSIHVICFALFLLSILLIFITKKGIAKQNNATNGKAYELKVLIFEFEKIKTKLTDMKEEPQKMAVKLIDGLIDELRFSNFNSNADVSDIDFKLRSKVEILSLEVDNLILIESSDLNSMKAIVNDVKKIIKDRNMQISLMNTNI